MDVASADDWSSERHKAARTSVDSTAGNELSTMTPSIMSAITAARGRDFTATETTPARSTPENLRMVRSTPTMRGGHRKPGAAKPSRRASPASKRATPANSAVLSAVVDVCMEPIIITRGCHAVPTGYGCLTMPSTVDTTLNPMQQAVVDALGKSPEWTPLPRDVVENVRGYLDEHLADIASRFSRDDSLWVSKQRLNTIHGCEAHHLATRDSFEWTPLTARGTVLHKAVELGVHWKGEPTPSDVVDEAIARLSDSNNNIADFLVAMTPGDRAQLRSFAVDLYTRFEECFPPLKPAWRPVSESPARYEMFGGAIVLATKADLTLGLADQKVIIDVKSGGLHTSHREDLRFYALVEALRSGMAPRRLASYSIAAARADVEDVSEGVLQAAARRVVAGVRSIVEVELDAREPVKRPAGHCRWCPLNDTCAEGIAFLTRDPNDDE